MKILITIKENDLYSQVDPRFGRAAAFLIVDVDSSEFTVIDNTQNLQAREGAGIQAAQHACDVGADWVLTGHVGPKAYRALSAAGIKIATGITGSARAALEKFQLGEIKETDGANVEGHW